VDAIAARARGGAPILRSVRGPVRRWLALLVRRLLVLAQLFGQREFCCRYLLGGAQPSSYTNPLQIADCERFDFRTHLWKSVCELPVACAESVAGCVQGRIVLAGGRVARTDCVKSVIVFDPAKNKWTAVASMNLARSSAAGVLMLLLPCTFRADR
jgi:hypothetical protein